MKECIVRVVCFILSFSSIRENSSENICEVNRCLLKDGITVFKESERLLKNAGEYKSFSSVMQSQ
jgi:hypothetical protein